MANSSSRPASRRSQPLAIMPARSYCALLKDPYPAYCVPTRGQTGRSSGNDGQRLKEFAQWPIRGGITGGNDGFPGQAPLVRRGSRDRSIARDWVCGWLVWRHTTCWDVTLTSDNLHLRNSAPGDVPNGQSGNSPTGGSRGRAIEGCRAKNRKRPPVRRYAMAALAEAMRPAAELAARADVAPALP